MKSTEMIAEILKNYELFFHLIYLLKDFLIQEGFEFHSPNLKYLEVPVVAQNTG